MHNAEQGYAMLEMRLRQLSGIDLAAYKQRQIQRRLGAYLGRTGVANLSALADTIAADPVALKSLKEYLTINVTEFFRDGRPFAMLAERVLPDLRAQHRQLRVWSAGCSIGAEPYSVAMLLAESDPLGQHHVLGTDLDASVLAVAREGVYAEDKLKGLTPARRHQFFTVEDARWRVGERIRRQVHFRQHNLLTDPYPGQQHLILCRNVVIYFTEERKNQVYAQLVQALVPGGYLLVGATETVFMPGKLGLEPAGPFLYRRLVAADRRVGAPFSPRQ